MSSKNSPNQTILNSIHEGTIINGEIQATGNIRIDGKINGNITSSGKIVLGEKGHISGDIKAESLDTSGLIEGNINTKALYLKENAKILSDITTEQIIIEPGAQFSGNCSMPNKKVVKN
jgi:cytoskeletal protein CcmA (bactofilin family)